LVIEVTANANVPKLVIINSEVNILPEEDNSLTSENPTVDTVMIVI